jgi:hypothetical protein
MKAKHTNVTDTLVHLHTVAEVTTATVTVIRNYCNSVNKRTYNGFWRILIMFFCRKLQVLAKICVNTLSSVVVFIPFLTFYFYDTFSKLIFVFH